MAMSWLLYVMTATPAGYGTLPPPRPITAGYGACAAPEGALMVTEKEMDLPPSEQVMLMVLPDRDAVTVGLAGLTPSSSCWSCCRISARLHAHSSLVRTRVPSALRKGSGSLAFLAYWPCVGKLLQDAGSGACSCARASRPWRARLRERRKVAPFMLLLGMSSLGIEGNARVLVIHLER